MQSRNPLPQLRGRLPAEVTTFVGRQRELDLIGDLLADHRLVTLTGTSGIGKTRLALRFATEAAPDYPDGAFFMDLAAVPDPHLVPSAIMAALGLRHRSVDPLRDIVRSLNGKEALLLFDNCEHLTAACAGMVNELEAAGPGVRILATSRQALGAGGERVVHVHPLPVPAQGDRVTAEDVETYEAVELLVARASAADPGFELHDRNRDSVLELCRRLDGMPLALELAAVWLRVLSPAQVLDRLEERFKLLSRGHRTAPARHQALEAAVSWSFELCSPEERLLWARLSVFSGGFALDGAQDVCAGDGIGRDDVPVLLAALVDKSLVIEESTEDGPSWYRMLETIREYGFGRIDGRPSMDELRRRHRDYYALLARRVAEEDFGPHQAAWFRRLSREVGNVRTALRYCLDKPGEAETGVDLAARLWSWWITGLIREGYRHLAQALELATEPTPVRGHGLWAASYLALFTHDFNQAMPMIAEAAEIAERHDDDTLRAMVEEVRGLAQMYGGDLEAATTTLEEARAVCARVGDERRLFDTLILLTSCALFREDPEVERYAEQALEIARRRGGASALAYALRAAGTAKYLNGRHQDAAALLRESIRHFVTVQDVTGLSFDVQTLAWCAAAADPDEYAAQLLGAVEAAWRRTGARVPEIPWYQQHHARAQDAARRALGETRFEDAYVEGTALTLDEIVALALTEPSDAG
jgi:predicted ATPase